MKKIQPLFCLSFLSLFIFSTQLYCQDFDHYQPLKSSGQVPEKFRVSSTEKYEKDIQTLSNKEKRRLRKIKKQFYLENSFAINNLLLSGRIVFNDPVSQYVNKVMDEILKDDKELRGKIEIYIIKSNSVNAFTLQNGVICIYVGLLTQLHNEAELAFILCHELTHFTEQHILNSVVENANIKDGQGSYRRASINEKELAASKFSKKNETEADGKGLDRFLKTGYDASTLAGAFDIMEYCNQPYREMEYEKSFLETANLKFPPNYFLKKTKKIEPDDNDSLSTHPAANLRREAVMGRLKGIDKAGKNKFIVGEQEFYNIQKICRYELCDILIHYREYEAAFYNAYMLLKDNPNSLYLKKCIAKSIYGLSKFENADRFDDAHDDYNDVEGPSQQVYYFFHSLKGPELNALAVEYLYNLKKQYPEDKEIAEMTKDIFGELPDHYPDISFFSKEPKPASLDSVLAADTIASSDNADDKDSASEKANANDNMGKSSSFKPLSKYDKSHLTEKKIRKNPFIKYAFVDLLKDTAFVNEYKTAIIKFQDKKKEADYENTAEYRKSERKYERRVRRQGVALGLNKVVILNPYYYKLDASHEKNPVKLVASEMAQKDFDNSIKTNATLAGLNYELIDMKELHANDADLYNDLSVLNNYITEVSEFGDMHFVNYMTDDVQALTKKYGTSYFDWTGILCFREHNEYGRAYSKTMGVIFSLFYFPITPFMIYNAVKVHYNTYVISTVYNLSDGETEHNYVAKIKFKDRQDVINSTLYDLYLQFKKTRKS